MNLVEIDEQIKMVRKQYSEVQKRIIAYNQHWMCVGEKCNGQVQLSANWNLDHIIPLFQGGSNDFTNLQILCSDCHAIKTQKERIEYYFTIRNKSFNKRTSNTKQVSLYLQNKKRWRVWQGKNKSSKYFSCLKFGSVEKAKNIALEFCKMNNLEVKHCSPL